MSDYLQKHFEETSKQSHLKLLESQWSFDKKLIPKALQHVGQLFPHYSRHDQSHSEQILINIERLLGEHRIKLLSATDTWLLLEAAYWHDIGMVVPYQALKDALEKPEFQTYRQQIAADSSNELQDFANHFDSTDLSKAFTGAQSPLDAVNKFRLLMAEWFRREHPNRAEKSVNDPWQELGLSSPRTELIPKRLFRLLGRICALHGASFADVISQLPHKEVGMSNDDCHPRFVACLLRLGDLLDMDDNRFCPVMQRIAGDNRPALSKAHEDKHNSIRHFRLDSNRIEISAVCETIDGYVEQWRWIDYLRGEMQSQMARWQDIAPSPELGLLPTLGEVKVDLAGKQLITKPGIRPEFGLNADRAMKLLKGDNLYQHADAIRELLQNAVDATLIRIWLASKSESKTIGDEPNDVSKDYFNKHQIQARLERIEKPEPPISDEQIKWRVTVIDQGIGISQEDLPYLMNVASSSTNAKRQALINEMPEWLQPSGTFGIGLQSIFMWAEVVRIKTKSIYTHEALDIALHSPTGPQHGLVTIELAENAYLRPIGTELSFDLLTEKLPSRFSISADQAITTLAYDNHDSLLDEELPIKAFQIGDAILKFTKHSPIKVQWLYKNLDEEFSIPDEAKNDDEDSGLSDFFSETSSKFSVHLGWMHEQSIFYRGQHVKDAKPPAHYFFGYTLDLYSGKAGEWLTFNRNNLTEEGKEKIGKVVARNLKLWIEKNEKSLASDKKAFISILAKVWATMPDAKDDQAYWQEQTKKFPDDWKSINCSVMADGKTTKDRTYLDVIKKDVYIDWQNSASSILKYDLPQEAQVLTDTREFFAQFSVQAWCNDTPSHGIRYITADVTQNNLLNPKPQSTLLLQLISVNEGSNRLEINNKVLAFAIEQKATHSGRGRRMLIPLMLFPESLKMERLLLKSGITSWGFQYVLPYQPDFPMPHICLPYEIFISHNRDTSIGLSRLDEFVKWVNLNLKNPLTFDQTKTACNELIAYVDNTLMAGSERWKALRSNRRN